MTVIGDAYIAIRGDTSTFSVDVQKNVESSLTGIASKGAEILGGIYVGAKFVDAAKAGIDRLKEEQGQAALTEAAIASTGGAANVSSGHLEELAKSLEHVSGASPETITAGENVLLTFTKVSNQVGAGHDIYDRATKDALDLSYRGFGTMESASKALGIALTDPEQGFSRLRRAGIILTDSQKETIKSLEDSGDLLGAQGALLDIVEGKVGGAAKAYGDSLPGSLDKAKQSLTDMEASLVSGAAPAMSFFANVAEKGTSAVAALPGPLRDVVAVAGTAGVAFVAVARPLASVIQLYDRFVTSKRASTDADTEESRKIVEKTGLLEGEVAANEQVAASNVELSASTDEVVASLAGLDEATTRRVTSNEALVFSDTEVAAAMQERDTAAAMVLVGNDALIASDEELVAAAQLAATAAAEKAAADDALATAEYIAAEGAAAEGTAMDLLLGPVGLIAGAAALAIGGLTLLSDSFGTNTVGAADYSRALDQASRSTSGLADPAAAAADTVTAQKLALNDSARAAVAAGITWQTLGREVRAGTEDFGGWDRIATSTVNTSRNSAEANQLLAANLRAAGAGASEFGAQLIASLESGKLTAIQVRDLLGAVEGLHNGYTQASGDQAAQTAALEGMGPAAEQAAGGLDKVEKSQEQIQADHVKALETQLRDVQSQADKAFSAVLRLAPANIRVQEGQLSLADDQQRVIDAQQKLDDLRAGASSDTIAASERSVAEATNAVGDAQQKVIDAQNKLNGLRTYGGSASDIAAAERTLTQAQLGVADSQKSATDAQKKLDDTRKGASPDDLAQAERDLQKAQLDVQTATLDQAQALTDLQTEQDAANGKTDDANTITGNYLANLGKVNDTLTGPTHDAINTYIWDATIAYNKTKAWADLFTGVANTNQPGYFNTQGSVFIGGGTTGLKGNAEGGPVTAGETFRAAEQDQWEVLLSDSLYTATKPGRVLSHADSVRWMRNVASAGVVERGLAGRSVQSSTQTGHVDDHSITLTVEKMVTPDPPMSAVVLGRSLRGLRHRATSRAG